MSTLEIEIRNVGGIDEASFAFQSPVSIITGPNATNKTSLLQALAFALGRDEVSIKSDADEAEVTLTIGERTVTRTASRRGRGVQIGGDAWVSDSDDRELFEYFGCLLEFNPLRSAVRQNEDIESVLKEPIDIDALEAEQSAKISEKRRLQRQVDQLEDVETELRERERTIEEKREREAELESELERLQEKQAATSDADEDLDALREERADLVVRRDDLGQQIDDIEAAMERLESEREETRAELEQKRREAEEYDVDELKSKRRSLRSQIEEITQRQDVLQSVLTTNREMLNSEYTGVLGQESDLMGENVTCWVCGDSTPVSDIEENIDQLRTVIERDSQKIEEFEPQIETVDAKIDEAKTARQAVQELEQRLEQLNQELEDRRESLEIKRDLRATVDSELDELDEQIAELESEQTSEITDLTEEIESTRIELQSVRQSIQRAEEQIETLEEKRRDREEKRERIDDLSAEIASLTERIENMEHHLRDDFNDAMEDLITELEFQRIERVWLDGQFDLVIARAIDGSVRQDSLQSLSESEREVIGLVLALAGYKAFDLDSLTPVLQMDTLGALDADRLVRLIEYFSDEPEFLIAAVLPETAESIDYSSVRPIEQTRFTDVAN
jgi:chromosome segregation ATPase